MDMNTTPQYGVVSYQVVPSSPQLEKDVLWIAASLEAQSGQSTTDIVDVAKTNGLLPLSVDHFQDAPGRGMGGMIKFSHESHVRPVIFGTKDFVTQCRFQIPELLDASIREWESEAGVVLRYIGWEGSIRGVFKLRSKS